MGADSWRNGLHDCVNDCLIKCNHSIFLLEKQNTLLNSLFLIVSLFHDEVVPHNIQFMSFALATFHEDNSPDPLLPQRNSRKHNYQEK